MKKFITGIFAAVMMTAGAASAAGDIQFKSDGSLVMEITGNSVKGADGHSLFGVKSLTSNKLKIRNAGKTRYVIRHFGSKSTIWGAGTLVTIKNNRVRVGGETVYSIKNNVVVEGTHGDVVLKANTDLASASATTKALIATALAGGYL